MSDSGRIDGIDLPSLASFRVDGDSGIFGSFRFAKLRMHSFGISMSSEIDLPSLKSIILGDGCFRESPRVEMISKDELRHLAHRSSSIEIIAHWLIRLPGKQSSRFKYL